MTQKNPIHVPDDVKTRGKAVQDNLRRKPGVEDLLTPQERADAAPFYTELRAFVKQLRGAREKAGLTLAQVADRAGLAAESLSRLETGALTNPTWKTLGAYATAVGVRIRLAAEGQ